MGKSINFVIFHCAVKPASDITISLLLP